MSNTDVSRMKDTPGGGVAGKVFRQVQEMIEDTRGESGTIIRTLEKTQGMLGYLPTPVLKTISRDLRIPLSEVYGIASFYNFFTLAPRGKYVIQVCMGTACYVRGADLMLNYLRREYGLEPGDTTPDGRFSLEIIRCLGACAQAPAVIIEGDIYRRVTPNGLREIMAIYR